MARLQVADRKGEVDYDIPIPNVGTKQFHVNLLKAWSDATELEPAYDAFLGVEADIDWVEESQWRAVEIAKQMEEGIPPSAWQA